MTSLRGFVAALLAGKDSTADWAHFLGIVGGLSFIVYGGVDLFVHGQWDAQAYGIGFGSMATGIGVLLWGKRKSEGGP